MRTLLHNKLIVSGFLLVLVFISSCQKSLRLGPAPAPDHTLILQFKPVVDADSLEYGKTYQNIFGESYTVRNFKFYFYQVELINTDSGKSYKLKKDDHYLVNFADPNSTKIELQVVSATYNRIVFTIGVDSIRNVSGAQTGALDPANGMFWTWNSGYIMAKLEGNSTVSNQPNQVFEYHIGGFSENENVTEKVSLGFPLNGAFALHPGSTTLMSISANANTWFSGPNPTSIASTPVCTTPGTLAKSIAANYAHMFKVVNIVSE